MLKANLHMHSSEDPFDNSRSIDFSPKEIIDEASKLGFNVLSFTHHEEVFFDKKIFNYAKKKNILLIPGIELTVENKHILIYNITQEEINKIKKIEDLAKIKRKDSLIIAAHPFFIQNTFGSKLKRNIDLFDAIEYSGFFKGIFNLNRKAVRLAKRYGKPMVATSDTHLLKQLNYSYTFINSKKNINEIISAVKKGKIKNVTKPISWSIFLKRSSAMFYKNKTLNFKKRDKHL